MRLFVAIIPRNRDGNGRVDDPGNGYDTGYGYILNRTGTDGKLVVFYIDLASFSSGNALSDKFSAGGGDGPSWVTLVRGSSTLIAANSVCRCLSISIASGSFHTCCLRSGVMFVLHRGTPLPPR